MSAVYVGLRQRGEDMSSKRVRIGEMFERLHIGHFKKAYTRDGSEITYTQSGEVVTRPRQTEKEAFLDASGKQKLEPQTHPLYTPENHHERKSCTRCKLSKQLKHFTKIKKRNGLVIYHSWCDTCRAEYRMQVYYDAKSLKRFP